MFSGEASNFFFFFLNFSAGEVSFVVCWRSRCILLRSYVAYGHYYYYYVVVTDLRSEQTTSAETPLITKSMLCILETEQNINRKTMIESNGFDCYRQNGSQNSGNKTNSVVATRK